MNQNMKVTEYIKKQNSTKTSSEIISELKQAADNWRNGLEQADDMTLVVIKYKEPGH